MRTRAASGRPEAGQHLPALLSDDHDASVRVRNGVPFASRLQPQPVVVDGDAHEIALAADPHAGTR